MVMDTNVIVSGLRNPSGASAELIDQALAGRFTSILPWHRLWNTKRYAVTLYVCERPAYAHRKFEQSSRHFARSQSLQ